MFRAFRLLICVTTLLLFDLCSASVWGQNSLTLKVTSVPDPTHAFPGSELYKALVRNEGTKDIFLDAVQMPGGYAGKGRFFRCTLQVWDPKQRRWSISHEAKLGDYGDKPGVVQVRVQPGAEVEVCRSILPHDAGIVGGKARFLLGLTWTGGTLTVTSPPFVIGNGSSSNR